MYTFNGWNTKADGTGISYSESDVIKALADKESITLYAQWLGEEFEITFDANGGETPITSKMVRYGETYGELPVPVRDGYGFTGWSSNGLSFKSTSKVQYAESYRTLVAGWRENAYTIVFNANGGEGLMDPIFALFNGNKTLSSNVFVRDGYSFVGWNTKEDGSGVSYSDEAVIKLDSVENSLLNLYAQWEEGPGYVINNYSSSEEDGYISLIPGNTSLEDYKENIVLKDGYSVEVDLGDKSKIFTGSKTRIYKGSTLIIEFINIVSGDVTGDGLINIADVIKIADHSIRSGILVNDYEKLASDVTGDNIINIADVVKIADYTLDNSINLWR